MKLTIITPTLNAVAFLERAIQSVLSQDFDSIEHLIIDGGSSDGTMELARRYSHLRIIRASDEGIFDAMNKSIAAASGDWIYFLGADDYFADAYVLRDIDPIFESELDVVYGDIFDAHMGHRYDGPSGVLKIRKRNISHQAIFFKRSVFEKIGLFDESYPAYADWDHNMRWMLNHTIHKKYVDRIISVYAGDGYSFHNPDKKFRRDRLYRYLTYGKDELPAWKYWAVWGEEFGLGVLRLDWARIKRAVSIALDS